MEQVLDQHDIAKNHEDLLGQVLPVALVFLPRPRILDCLELFNERNFGDIEEGEKQENRCLVGEEGVSVRDGNVSIGDMFGLIDSFEDRDSMSV